MDAYDNTRGLPSATSPANIGRRRLLGAIAAAPAVALVPAALALPNVTSAATDTELFALVSAYRDHVAWLDHPDRDTSSDLPDDWVEEASNLERRILESSSYTLPGAVARLEVLLNAVVQGFVKEKELLGAFCLLSDMQRMAGVSELITNAPELAYQIDQLDRGAAA